MSGFSPPPLPEWMRRGAFVGYLAVQGFLPELFAELGDVERVVLGDLVFVRQQGGADESTKPMEPAKLREPAKPAAWAQNTWLNPRVVPAPSIGRAAKSLRALQRNWWPHPVRLARRTALVAGELPKVSAKPQVFGEPAPTAPLGAFTLWDEGTLIASPSCSSPYPDGRCRFVEDRGGPPNRAYLKLWETFTLLGVRPKAGELCLDLGASPGGWTWVLAGLGAHVFSLDKAPLEPDIAAMANVEHCLGSGFGLEPHFAGGPECRVDWLFSDMACYPERLLELVRRWLAADACRSFVCTLKFQGATDHATARAFAAIPGSRLLHLSCNKHELTWALIR